MSCLSTYHPVELSGLHEGCFNPELVPLHGNTLSELYDGPVHLERIFKVKSRTGLVDFEAVLPRGHRRKVTPRDNNTSCPT